MSGIGVDEGGGCVDAYEIQMLIARQAAASTRVAGRTPEWNAFHDCFLPDAAVFSSTRPARKRSVAEFVDRMCEVQSEQGIHTLSESTLGCHVRVFGNIAVALTAHELLENECLSIRNVNAYLLLKDENGWRIAAQASDSEAPEKQIPADLLVAA